MSVRYIFNTNGDYVAFIQNDNLFDPNTEWLGFIRNGNEVYSKTGDFLGYLLSDDRIARKKGELKRLRLLRPLTPLRPLRPLRPLKRLPMLRLPFPYEDVFETFVFTAAGPVPKPELNKYDYLIGSKLYAHDNTYLGKVSKDKYDQDSISNQYGPYGSRYHAVSIFNQYGLYGGQYSQYSPFNKYSFTPPRLIKDSTVMAELTVNPYVNNRVDANEFVAWLGIT